MDANVAVVGTYPPTACGLATYTSNLRDAISAPEHGWVARVLRLTDDPGPSPSDEVVGHWVAGDPASLGRAVELLNTFDAVLLQHEYGLFGGSDGEEALDLVEGVHVPLVLDVHTALPAPTRNQRRILDHLLGIASLTVVHSEAARQVIVDVHDVDPLQLVVIHHGAAANFGGSVSPSVPRPAVLTWGLIGPGKGIEHGIAAIARMQSCVPPPTYLVAGTTHPKVLEFEGDRYRNSLIAIVRALRVADRIVFDDAYRSWESLRQMVRSVDAVLLPYDSRDQVSSGVLVEALASAKPVVATRFPHAEELLAGGVGILVEHGDVDAMAVALHRVLYEPGVAASLSAAAKQTALRNLLWPTVGMAYRAVISDAVQARVAA